MAFDEDPTQDMDRPVKDSAAVRSRILGRAARWGAVWGLSLGALALAAGEAYRPGFLALPSVRGWTAAFAVLGFATVVGWAAGSLFRRRAAGIFRRGSLLGVWLAAFMLALAGWGVRAVATESPPRARWRVLVFGVDGATWKMIEPMARAGSLPHFARLLGDGATGVLTSEEPTLSPRVWTTIATGVGPERHGAHDFYSTQSSIEVARIWEVVDAEGGRIGVWRWLLTWPPGQPDGFIVPSWMDRGPETWPPELSFFQTLNDDSEESVGLARLAAATFQGYRHGLRLPTMLKGLRVALWVKLAHPSPRQATPTVSLLGDEISTDVFVELWRRWSPDFSAMVLYNTDAFAHQYWRDFDPAAFGLSTPPDGGRFKDVLPGAYRQADRTLGRLMDIADDRTILIVLSDHGTEPRELEKQRYSIRLAPLLRALGKEQKLAAFTVGRYVYLRELGTPRASSGDLPAFVAELAGATVNGERLFEVSAENLPYFSLAVRGTPPLSEKTRIAGKIVPLSRFIIASDFSGEHSLKGIIGFWGKPVLKGARIEGATLRDVAPTILTLLDSPVSAEMSGRVLTEAFEPRRRARLVPRRVDEYGPPPHLVRGDETSQAGDEALKKKLRALGYIQ